MRAKLNKTLKNKFGFTVGKSTRKTGTCIFFPQPYLKIPNVLFKKSTYSCYIHCHTNFSADSSYYIKCFTQKINPNSRQ